MKKVLCAVTVFAVLLSLCSCGGVPIVRELNELLISEKHIDWDGFSVEKPADSGSKYKIYFDTLSEKQKKGYNNIFYSIMNAEDSFPERIEVPLMESKELTQVYEAVIYDNPEIMCFGKGASIITEGELCFFEPEYTMIPEEFHRRISLLSETSDKICSAFDEYTSEFERELYIHDYIVKNCIYDCEKDDSGLAYSCLLCGYASCEGYSKAAKYLLEKAGIECYNVLGDAENLHGETESHMWNLVKIEDGYYYLDVTWDDPAEETGLVSHTYFNLTENEIRVDHSNFTALLPCTSNEANYYVKTGCLFYSADYYDRIKMENIIINCLENGQNCVELRFADENAYNSAVNTLITESRAYEIQTDIRYKYPHIKMSDEINYSKNEKYRIIELIF